MERAGEEGDWQGESDGANRRGGEWQGESDGANRREEGETVRG